VTVNTTVIEQLRARRFHVHVHIIFHNNNIGTVKDERFTRDGPVGIIFADRSYCIDSRQTVAQYYGLQIVWARKKNVRFASYSYFDRRRQFIIQTTGRVFTPYSPVDDRHADVHHGTHLNRIVYRYLVHNIILSYLDDILLLWLLLWTVSWRMRFCPPVHDIT